MCSTASWRANRVLVIEVFYAANRTSRHAIGSRKRLVKGPKREKKIVVSKGQHEKLLRGIVISLLDAKSLRKVVEGDILAVERDENRKRAIALYL